MIDNRKMIIIPDVHGRTFWKDVKNMMDEDGYPKHPIIFLGDYTDPYSSEGITEEECYNNFLEILDFKKEFKKYVTLLLGNHELCYVNPKYDATRMSRTFYERYREKIFDISNHTMFQLCKKIGKYLFIHAGITKSWYEKYKETLDGFGEDGVKYGNDIETQLNNFFLQQKDPFYEISYSFRGGYNLSGSPLWADIQEFMYEGEPFNKNIIQIVGHTQLKINSPFIPTDNIVCLDNRQIHVLDLKTGNFNNN